ncbi:hypothetical protein DERP_006742, partial [Dermatophagoides pteronyssinus]
IHHLNPTRKKRAKELLYSDVSFFSEFVVIVIVVLQFSINSSNTLQRLTNDDDDVAVVDDDIVSDCIGEHDSLFGGADFLRFDDIIYF